MSVCVCACVCLVFVFGCVLFAQVTAANGKQVNNMQCNFFIVVVFAVYYRYPVN